MAKIRLTKSELKNQKESLKRFLRYLPMLQLKKKQLQLEIIKIQQAVQDVSGEMEDLRNRIIPWVDVFAQDVGLKKLVSLVQLKITQGNVAGIELPILQAVEFKEESYDLMATPLWVDEAIVVSKENIILKAKLAILHKQREVLKEELRITNQRVNLFEKVKIPQAQENIRVIQIFLGELRTAEVVRGKIAKAKIEKRKVEEVQAAVL